MSASFELQTLSGRVVVVIHETMLKSVWSEDGYLKVSDLFGDVYTGDHLYRKEEEDVE